MSVGRASRFPAALRRAAAAALVRVLAAPGVTTLLRLCADRYRVRRGRDGRARLLRLGRHRGTTFQVLTYHRVLDEPDAHLGGMPTAVFAAQMAYLAGHASVLSLREILDRLDAGRPLPPRAVAVTFDDGYRDVYERAFPILERHGLPATVFLVSDYLGSGKVLWYDRVMAAFRRTGRAFVRLGDGTAALDLRSPASREAALEAALRLLRRLPDAERRERVEWICRYLASPCWANRTDLMLDWAEVHRMARSEITFGSHTASHPILATMGREAVMDELLGSKRRLEEALGTPVDLFAFPNGRRGDFDDAVKAMVREAGYRAAATTIAGVNDEATDRFELRRTAPWEADVARFASRLSWHRLTC